MARANLTQQADRTARAEAFCNPLASCLRFFVTGLVNRTQTGAILPSSGILIRQMLSPIPQGYSGEILELGPGTGALTMRLAARCPAARIVACEINSDFADELKVRVDRAGLSSRVQVVCDSAEHLLALRARKGGVPLEFIVSGIPLGNLPKQDVLKLIESIRRGLRPGGMYIQFQYSLVDRKKIRAVFSRLRTIPVVLNVPPAFIYFATR